MFAVKKKIVITFGTFDYFHEGHEHYLKEAKKFGEYLIVVVSRDKTVRQIKGQLPMYNERKRASIVRDFNIADKVILGSTGDKHQVLKKYRPNIIALGYDQFIFTQKLKKTLIDLKLDANIERIDAFYPQVFKSSLLKKSVNDEKPGLVEKFNLGTSLPKTI